MAERRTRVEYTPTAQRPSELTFEAREILRDVKGRSQLHHRIKLSGMQFPQLAYEPFVRIGKVQSRYVEISDDGTIARAYFDRPLPQRGVLEFGYGDEVLFRLPGALDAGFEVERLDRARLPKDVLIPWETQ